MPTSASALTWSRAIPVARAAPLAEHGVPVAVSCPTSRLCVGVDTFGNVFSTADPRSGPWSLTTVLHRRLSLLGDETSTQAFTDIACPSATACLATDNHGDLIASRDPTGGAGAWRVLRPAALRRTHADAIACPTAGLCLLGLDDGRIAVSTRPLAGATAWARSQRLHRGFRPAAISCPSRRLCVIGGYHGTNGAYAISLDARGRVLGVRRQRGSGVGFEALSCPTATMCFGSTGGSRFAFIRRPADARSRWTVSAAHYADYDPTGSLACPNPHLCAAGIETNRDQAEVLVSTRPTNPRGWHVAKTTQPLAELVLSVPALSCPSARFAGGPTSCPSPTLCVTVSKQSIAATSTPTNGGSWLPAVAEPAGANLTGVACPTVTLCVASDDQGAVLTSTDPASGTSWARATIDPGHALNGVACGSATACVAFDNRGMALQSSDPVTGGSWSAISLAAGTDVYGQPVAMLAGACSGPAACVLTDSVGYLFYGTA